MEFVGYLFHWSDHPVGQLHLGTAYLAIILGPIVFLNRKGTTFHRIVGYLFVASMLTLNIAALTRYTLTGGFNFFHFAALASLATLIPGLYFGWQAHRRKSRGAYVTHGILMSWAYFGMMMAFIAESVTRQLPFLLHGENGWVRFFGFMIPVMALTAWWTNRQIRRHVIPGA
jgi:uncharacterized membrane protein